MGQQDGGISERGGRALIVPRFVYATPGDFADGEISNSTITERVAACALDTAELTRQRLG